ncbi:hypothetical protein N7489_008295 [Penicillium chrysogenum]|uniref:Uncharacterized protein n=1 Tax=Penicillium chrysogenum TaxID=5076 RepID=A0ABQ8W9M6_PENCH|nr:uncharacterized protein N7489_008295 [Penicillium chrysogenum]KAJ5238204.1 hypothetical protein N7489_008295 [Penicillium chrysogenum]KAJ5261530.1 hypothetical protein N7505_008397 [Penicillium chrysogenum]KAJ6159455.1 hypothetical protein N7497_003992 [Penicillium chrysogenum]
MLQVGFESLDNGFHEIRDRNVDGAGELVRGAVGGGHVHIPRISRRLTSTRQEQTLIEPETSSWNKRLYNVFKFNHV